MAGIGYDKRESEDHYRSSEPPWEGSGGSADLSGYGVSTSYRITKCDPCPRKQKKSGSVMPVRESSRINVNSHTWETRKKSSNVRDDLVGMRFVRVWREGNGVYWHEEHKQ